jgi:hypothetical protein
LGVNVTISGKPVEFNDYVISESATPLAGGDSSGSVGSISLKSVVPTTRKTITPRDLDGQVTFLDTARGVSSGRISGLSIDHASGAWDVEADSRLGLFMIDVQVAPYSGTLENAFKGYAGYANITANITVDASFASRPVNFPGFSGNLWQRMKELAIGVGADLNLVSNVIVLRPARAFTAITDRESSANVSYDKNQIAHRQEVIWYDTKYITAGLVYPPGGWTPEVRVLSVNAGEDMEQLLDTGASIGSIQQPVMSTSVPPEYDSSSVYTIVGDDNLPIQPAQWRDYGGTFEISIEPDTRRLKVKMHGAENLVKIDGTPMRSFRVALSAGTSDSTYSTLRIVGDAVHLNPQSVIIPTGAPYPMNGSEVAEERIVNAPTIDNEFLNTLDAACSAGARGAGRYSGKLVTMSGVVTALNRRGQRGDASYPTWAFAKAQFPGTYATFKAANAARNYGTLREYLYSLVETSFDNQLFGNAPGARYWDQGSRLWFRVREAKTSWGDTSVSADIDTLWGDYKTAARGRTYGTMKGLYVGGNYRDMAIEGLPN